MSSTVDNGAICKQFYEEIEVEDEKDGVIVKVKKWKCKCGKLRTKGNGWSNLMEHLIKGHENYKEEIQISSGGDGTQSMDEFVTHVSKKAKNLPRHR